MPAEKKVTRESIIKAAFAILRKEGIEKVNARSIAKKLGCSTQPIYHTFTGMDELKLELEKAAAERHVEEVRRCMEDSRYTRYMAFGIGFVHLAKEEKELFRYLYMTKHGDMEKAVLDVNLTNILNTICEEYGYSMETARNFHGDMTIYSYGLALGMNLGVLDMTDEEISQRLETQFIALTYVYGRPPRRPGLEERGKVK